MGRTYALREYYLRFAKGEKFDTIGRQVLCFDSTVPLPQMANRGATIRWNCSSIIRNQAIAAAEYTCEIDATHETFIAESNGHPYMEGHHVIPMAKQGNFDLSIDICKFSLCLPCMP